MHLTNRNNLIKLNNRKEEKNMSKQKIVNGLKTAGIMAKGIICFLILAFAVWSFLNFDVLVKTVKYPEAVRELKIDVRVSQFSK